MAHKKFQQFLVKKNNCTKKFKQFFFKHKMTKARKFSSKSEGFNC